MTEEGGGICRFIGKIYVFFSNVRKQTHDKKVLKCYLFMSYYKISLEYSFSIKKHPIFYLYFVFKIPIFVLYFGKKYL